MGREKQKVLCAHCNNSGITVGDGREWRCSCGKIPKRKVKKKRHLVFDLPRRDPYSLPAVAREIDEGSRSQFCGVEGCGELTTKKKPFCQTHIEQVTHGRTLSEELKQRKEEQVRVLAKGKKGWKEVDLNGSRAQELLNVLEVQGALTPEGLASKLAIDVRVLAGYIHAFERVGRVRVFAFETGARGRKALVTLVKTDES